MTPIERRALIAALADQLYREQKTLDREVRQCAHEHGDAQYSPEIVEAYEIPGDAPGTMGVDRRGPMWVSRKETPKWTRTCKLCGHTQSTTRTQVVQITPVF